MADIYTRKLLNITGARWPTPFWSFRELIPFLWIWGHGEEDDTDYRREFRSRQGIGGSSTRPRLGGRGDGTNSDALKTFEALRSGQGYGRIFDIHATEQIPLIAFSLQLKGELSSRLPAIRTR